MAEKMYNMEYNIDFFLQSLIAKTFKKTYNVDNVVVQVDIDDLGMLNFKAKTFNDDYTRVATYGGYVQRDASEIIITQVNGVYLTKMNETEYGIQYTEHFIHLPI